MKNFKTVICLAGISLLIQWSAQAQRTATAIPTVVNGFVVAVTVTDGGAGYANAPTVTITGGGGSGAMATATISNGTVDKVIVVNAGSGYTGAPIVLIAAPPSPKPPFSDGLVAYYPFNGNANDASGNGNNGTAVGATLAADRFGNLNSCYSFALNSRIDVGSGIQCGSPRAAWSASVWFKTTATQYSTFLTDLNPIPDTTYSTHFWIAGGNLGMNCKSGTSPVFIVRGTNTLNDGSWHSATFVADGNSHLFLYADGHLDGQASYDASLDYNGNPFWRINFLNNNSFDSLVGSIDDVRIYNRALSSQEVEDLYYYEAPEQPWLTIKVKTVQVTMHVKPTKIYQLESSLDLKSWANVGAAFVAASAEVVQEFNTIEVGRFFRLSEVP